MSKIKLERIASSILRELSSIIYEEVHNEIIKSVTITEVRVTNDLSMCKVFYTFYGTIFPPHHIQPFRKAP